MNNSGLFKIVLLVACVTLTACSATASSHRSSAEATTTNTVATTEPNEPNQPSELNQPGNEGTGIPVGGHLEATMNEADKLKMSRALDKATGKATHWTNTGSGISYTVTPVRKVLVEGKPFCREYRMTAERAGSEQQLTGTACIASDGNWHALGS